MPGLAGIFSSDRAPLQPKAPIIPMAEALRYLPDQQIITYEYPSLHLGKVDLGVFAKNSRPRETEDWLVFLWGEVNNPAHERRQILKQRSGCRDSLDDLEFVTALYVRHGDEFARFLSGSFNAIIFDKKRDRLLLANDRLGLRPLYYCQIKDGIVFSSQVKAILKHPDVVKKVDLAGVADFFYFGFVTGQKTLCQSVQALPPGSVLTFEKGRIHSRKYWELIFDRASEQRNDNYYVDQLAQAIRCSVESSTEGPYRFGLPLSGGLDSRTIAACIPKDKYPVAVWTWGRPDSKEVRTAKEVTEILGLQHNSLHRTPEHFVENFPEAVTMTDGMIPGNLPLANFLFKDTFADSVDICLDGAQSIGAMYPLRRNTLSRPNGLIDSLMPSLPDSILKSILKDQYFSSFKELAHLSRERIKASACDIDPIDRFQHLEITQKQNRFEFLGHAVKRNFVEVRTPLLNQPIIDVVRSIPPRLRKQRYIYHKALARLSPRLARIENVGSGVPVIYPHWLHLCGRVKKGIMLRVYNKIGQHFDVQGQLNKLYDWGINYAAWYCESPCVKNFTAEVLTAANIERCEYLNPSGINKILEEQFSELRDHSAILNRLLTNVIWSQTLG